MVKKDRQQIMAMVLSLLAAFIMWVYITNSENPQKSKTIYNIQVSLVNQDSIQQSGLALLPDQTFAISIKITGGANEVNSITASDFTASADMNTDLVSGENKIYVTLQQVPKNVKIDMDEEELFITVKLDGLKEKQVPVSLDIKGNPSSGFENAGNSVKPASVLVSGPAKYVDVVEVVTGKVDISGASDDVSGSTLLKALDSNGKEVSNITVSPQYADTTVSIKASKTVNVSVRTIGSASDDVSITSIIASPETITIIGDKDVISKITKIETQAIDVSKISQTQYVETNLNLPDGVTVLNNATGIKVTFNVEDIIEKVFTVDLTANNKSESMNYEYSSASIQVTVRGKKSIISGIAAGDITAAIDVKDMTEGAHDAVIKAAAPSGAELVKIMPEKVNVTVTPK